jgi:hypothetical protein
MSAWNNSAPTGRILIKFDMRFFSKICRENSNLIKIRKKKLRVLYTKTFRHFLHLQKFFLKWEMFQTKGVEKMKTHILCSMIFSENCTVYEIMSKNVVETERPQMTSQYGANALRAGLPRLYARMRMHTPTRPGTHMYSWTHARASMHTQTNTQYLLLFHSNNGFVNAPQCYVIRTLAVLFVFWMYAGLWLLYNGYRVSFPGVKRPKRGADHPPLSNAEV